MSISCPLPPGSCPPKILHVIDDLGLGGAQRQLVELLKGLKQKNYPLEVIALSTEKTDYAQAIRDLGIRLTLVPQSGKWSWSAFFTLKKEIGESRPDIVQTWLFTADLYGRIAAKMSGVPVIISTVRSVEPDKPVHYVFADRLLNRWTDRFIVNAKAVGDVLAEREKVSREKIDLIYNGLDLNGLDPAKEDGFFRNKYGLSAGIPVVGIVGRLAPVKDHETFLKAAALASVDLPEAIFLVVGGGPLKSKLELQAKDLGISSRVHFMESHPRVAEIYSGIDLLVVSSLYEGCSNVVLEAMAMGKPVIATSVGGNPELVIQGRTGLLVPPRDAQLLAQRIKEMVLQPQKRLEMGRQARLMVEERFTLGRMVDQTEAVYRGLAKKKK